jgi:hypothetical protein
VYISQTGKINMFNYLPSLEATLPEAQILIPMLPSGYNKIFIRKDDDMNTVYRKQIFSVLLSN